MPASKVRYWKAKFERNLRRDAKNRRLLRKLGWAVLVVRECEMASRKKSRLEAKLVQFLGPPPHAR